MEECFIVLSGSSTELFCLVLALKYAKEGLHRETAVEECFIVLSGSSTEHHAKSVNVIFL